MIDPFFEELQAVLEFSNPEKSLLRLEAWLDSEENELQRSEILSQIARCKGLLGKFEEGHELLNEIPENHLKSPSRLSVRVALERGRLFRSEKNTVPCEALFIDALGTAAALGEEFLAIDAAHMMALIAPSEEAMAWNEQALSICLASKEKHAVNWEGSIRNNMGWLLFDAKQFRQALSQFEEALSFRERNTTTDKDKAKVLIALWCKARCLRAMEQNTEALAIQEYIERERKMIGLPRDEHNIVELRILRGKE